MAIEERWRGLKPLPQGIRDKLGLLDPLFEGEGVLLVYLFGSLVKGEMASDIDLAVLPGNRDLGSLREKVCDVLNTQRLDLVNLDTASPVLRFEIVRNGVLIFKKHDRVENDFELSVIREYRDTAHLRKSQAKTLEERTKRWF